MRWLALVLLFGGVSYGADTVQDLEARGASVEGERRRRRRAGGLSEGGWPWIRNRRIWQDEVGFLLAVLNRRDEAIQSFQRAIDLDPKFAPAQYHLGAAYWLGKIARLSIPHLQSAAALDPGNFEYRYKYGQVLKSQGQYAEALPHLQAAVAADAQRWDAWNSLGMALQNTGDLAAAVDAYQHAVDLNPADPDARNNLGTTLV